MFKNTGRRELSALVMASLFIGAAIILVAKGYYAFGFLVDVFGLIILALSFLVGAIEDHTKAIREVKEEV